MSKKILMNINLNLPNHETELKKAEDILLEYEKKSKEQTKKRIKDAIETLKNSLRKISITAIAKESGVSRPTLYIYKDFINEHFESVKTISDFLMILFIYCRFKDEIL